MKYIEVVAAVIEKDDKVFCCQKGNKGESAYKLEFPDGKIELGETHKQALIREIKEELDCLIIMRHLMLYLLYQRSK